MAPTRQWIWLVLFVAFVPNVIRAQEPGWAGTVILVGDERLAMDATPVLERAWGHLLAHHLLHQPGKLVGVDPAGSTSCVIVPAG